MLVFTHNICTLFYICVIYVFISLHLYACIWLYSVYACVCTVYACMYLLRTTMRTHSTPQTGIRWMVTRERSALDLYTKRMRGSITAGLIMKWERIMDRSLSQSEVR